MLLYVLLSQLFSRSLGLSECDGFCVILSPHPVETEKWLKLCLEIHVDTHTHRSQTVWIMLSDTEESFTRSGVTTLYWRTQRAGRAVGGAGWDPIQYSTSVR